MKAHICVTCGVESTPADRPPAHCPICEDERQYVNPHGQRWTTMDALAGTHTNAVRALEPGLWEVVSEPKFAIGQRALLVRGTGGNVLWDCVSLVDEATIAAVEALGGVDALAMSHPHMFASMVAWSHTFGQAPIYVHEDLRRWVQRPDPAIRFWSGEHLALDQGVTLYRCGGHFRGATVLLWPEGADERGALLTTDTIFVTPDRRHVSFMYSYPNYIPLSAEAVDAVVARVLPLRFDRLYGHMLQATIDADAHEVIRRSAARYRRAIGQAR